MTTEMRQPSNIGKVNIYDCYRGANMQQPERALVTGLCTAFTERGGHEGGNWEGDEGSL